MSALRVEIADGELAEVTLNELLPCKGSSETVNEYTLNLVLWCLHSFLYLGSLFKASLVMSVLYRGLQGSYILILVDLAPFSPLEFAVGCAFLSFNQVVWIHEPKE